MDEAEAVELGELKGRRSSAICEDDRTRDVSFEKRVEQRLRISPDASGRRLE